jgi:hypothetical protein
MARTSRISTTRAASNRESDLREMSQAHYQSKLHVPRSKVPPDMTYSWVRESTLNEPDPDNVTDRMIRGWSPVPADRHPEMVPPALPGHEGIQVQIIRRGGLILCERPTRDVQATRQDRDRENIEMLQDVAWTGNADPNLPRFEDKESSVQFERVAAFKE